MKAFTFGYFVYGTGVHGMLFTSFTPSLTLVFDVFSKGGGVQFIQARQVSFNGWMRRHTDFCCGKGERFLIHIVLVKISMTHIAIHSLRKCCRYEKSGTRSNHVANEATDLLQWEMLEDVP